MARDHHLDPEIRQQGHEDKIKEQKMRKLFLGIKLTMANFGIIIF